MPERRAPVQKTIGILGGMSDHATAEYYRLLNQTLNRSFGGWDNGEIVIVSVNFGNIEYFVRNGLWDDARAYLSEKIDRLEGAKVDVIVCVSNTMHRVVGPIMAERRTPFIHIADPTAKTIAHAGLHTVGLLGTCPVMNAPDMRERYGATVLTPSKDDQEIIDRVIFRELVRRRIREESRTAYLRIVEEMRVRGAQGVILACTEIFLLIDQSDLPGFPVFDTTALHVDAIAAFATIY